MPYQIPGSDIVSIVDAEPTPLALLGPGRRAVALVQYESHPPVAQLARPFLSLGGLRVDAALAGRRRVQRLTGLSLLRLPAPDELAGTQPELQPLIDFISLSERSLIR